MRYELTENQRDSRLFQNVKRAAFITYQRWFGGDAASHSIHLNGNFT